MNKYPFNLTEKEKIKMSMSKGPNFENLVKKFLIIK